MAPLAMMHNTEDRDWWYQYGVEVELAFVAYMKEKMERAKISINPQKDVDVTAPDLLVRGRELADLKFQGTPFYSAERYGMDANHTVTFNIKDFRRYAASYPHLHLFFWVSWDANTWRDWTVTDHHGVYHIPFKRIQEQVYANAVPYHTYQRREGKEGNAKDSFLLDVRGMNKVV